MEGRTAPPKPTRGTWRNPERRLVLDVIAEQLGAKTDAQRAALFGIHWRTLYRLRNGHRLGTTRYNIAAKLPHISQRLRDAGQVLPADLTVDDVVRPAHAERAA